MKQLANLALQVMEEVQVLNNINNFKLERPCDNLYIAIRVLRNSNLLYVTNSHTWEDTRKLQNILDMLEYGPIVKPHFEVFTQMLNREHA